MSERPPHPHALRALTDAGLPERIDRKAENVSYAYNDLIAELDRRAAHRQDVRLVALAVLAAVAAIASATVALIALLVR